MRPITLFMHKLGEKLEWFPHQKPLFDAFVSRVGEGDTVELRLKKQGRKKTNAQLGYWFSVLLPCTVEGLRESGHNTLFNITVGKHEVGVETSIDTTDILLKTLFKAHKGLDKLPLKRNMTTAEMSDLIDFSLQWCAENLGIYIPTPESERQ